LAASPLPVGVWLQCAEDSNNVAKDVAVGFNLYVALCGSQSHVNNARAGGMRVLLQNDSGLKPFAPDSVNAGYMVGDEWDMTHPMSDCLSAWQSQLGAFPVDGRVRYANVGRGVAFWGSDAQAACWVNSVNIPSADVYWFSDNNACGPGEGGAEVAVFKQNNCHNAVNYGWLVNRVRSLVSPLGTKPVWAFVEVNCPFGGAGDLCASTAQMKAAVCHSLIAGARGIVYFNHSFKAGNGCPSDASTTRTCPAYAAAVTQVNGQLQSLAGVLNSMTITAGIATSGNVKVLGKWNGTNLYLLAGATPGAGSAGFALPSCVGNATATVLNENRTLPVTNGSFSDSFATDNTIHLYRIDGGSTCGLG